MDTAPEVVAAKADPSPRSKEFTGWKFNLLDGMASDPKLKPVDFHIAYTLVQRVNQRTRVAIISDNKLQRFIHRDRKALTLARKRLISLGWLEVHTGRSGKATVYRFLDDRAKLLANGRLDQQILDNEKEDHSEAKTPCCDEVTNEERTPHRKKQSSGEKTPHRANGEQTPHRGPQRGENTPYSGEKMHPLHLQTPKRETLSVKDRALRTYDDHVLKFDRWTEFEETAATLQYDHNLSRREAEHYARTQCGFEDGDVDGRQSADFMDWAS